MRYWRSADGARIYQRNLRGRKARQVAGRDRQWVESEWRRLRRGAYRGCCLRLLTARDDVREFGAERRVEGLEGEFLEVEAVD